MKQPTRTLRNSVALAMSTLLALTAVGVSAVPAAAAVGDTYRIQNPTQDAGTSIRFEGHGTTAFQTRLWQLAGQSGVASQRSYSVDFQGISPTTNNNYTQADWAEAAPPHGATPLSAEAQANRGRVEWILKNSYPTISNLNTLRDTIRATPGFEHFPSANWTSNLYGEAIAGTQAAIWHLTDGVELNIDNTSGTNNTTVANQRIRILYQYLLEQSEGAVASTPEPPTVEIVSDTGRDLFSIEPGTSFGPFTLNSSVNSTLSVSGPASIIDEQGDPVSGAQTPGTQFWLLPTASPAAPGGVTVTANTGSIPTTVVNAAFGAQHVSPNAVRETLAVTSTSNLSATTSLTANWVLDQSNPGDFDPDGSATEREFVHNQPGTLSPTLERIYFTDGTTTRTDVIGLAGIGTQSLDAYSADFPSTGANAPQGPNVADQTRFTEKDWNEAAKLADNEGQEEVARILSDSFPNVNLANLTQTLKDEGYLPPSAGNIKSWEAYAGTQAAIWNHTDGKVLDTTRYADPTVGAASSTAPGFDVASVLNADTSSGWQANEAGEAYIDFTFPARFEPRSYTVTSLEGGAQANTPAGWKLQRSFDDGATWSDVSTSSVTYTFAGGTAETRVSNNIPPGASYGAWTTTLRLVFTGAFDPAQPVEVSGVTFDGFGVFGSQPTEQFLQYANETNVVHLYNYLIARAGAAPIPNPEPQVEISGSSDVLRENGDELIGPFTLSSVLAPSDPLSARVTVTGHSSGAGLVTDPMGTPADALDLTDGDEFYFKPLDGESGGVTFTAQTTSQDWVTARALDGEKQGAQGPVLTALGVQSRNATEVFEVSFDVIASPEITLDRDAAYAEQEVEVIGVGFRPGEEVSLELHSTPIPLTTTVASATGSFVTTITVPTAAQVGPGHHVVGLGLESGRTARAEIEILATPGASAAEAQGSDPGTIATTGGELPIPLFLLGLLLLGGAAIALTARARSRASAKP